MAVAVNVFVKDTEAAPSAIQGVVVSVFDSITLAQIASATTDVNGRAAFLLGAGTYEVRLLKIGVLFNNPVAIAVVDPVVPPNTNDFDTTGTLLTLPVSVDPRKCRCTGRFFGIDGGPQVNSLVRIYSKGDYGDQVPKIVDGNLISGEAFNLHTDSNGYVTVDLYRTGQYWLVFAGEDETAWTLTVPDRSSANLVELVFPVAVLIEWDPTDAPGNAVSLAVGESKEVHFTVRFSNYIDYSESVTKKVTFDNSEPNLVDATVSSETAIMVVLGKAAGVSTIQASVNLDEIPNRVPPPGVLPNALTVTVS